MGFNSGFKGLICSCFLRLMKYLQNFLFAPRSVGHTAPQSCCVVRFLHIVNTNSQLAVTIRLDITLNNLRITRFKLTQNSNCLLDRNMNSFLGSGWTDFEDNVTTIFMWIRTSYLLGILNRLQYSAPATCLTCEVKMLPSTRGDPFVLPLVLIVEISSYVQPLPRKKYLFVKYLTLRLLMSYIYGAHILDVSRSHTTTHHSR